MVASYGFGQGCKLASNYIKHQAVVIPSATALLPPPHQHTRDDEKP